MQHLASLLLEQYTVKHHSQLFSITLTLESSTHKAVPCLPYSQSDMTYWEIVPVALCKFPSSHYLTG